MLDCLKHNLMEPDLVETFIREFHIEINKQAQVLAQGITDKKRNLEKLQARLDGLYDAVADGLRTPGLKTKIEAMEAEVFILKSVLDAAPPPPPLFIPILPNCIGARLRTCMKPSMPQTAAPRPPRSCAGSLSGLTSPPLGRCTFEIDLVGDIVNMIELAKTGPQTKTAASNETAVPDIYRIR